MSKTSSKSALELINVNKPNTYVKIGKSKIPSIEKDKYNQGLIATKFIKKGTKIVIYFGDVLDEEELMEKVTQHVIEEHKEIELNSESISKIKSLFKDI